MWKDKGVKRVTEQQLDNLRSQQEAAQAELGKPFPQEAELAEKSARLAELDALLNMDDRENDDPDRERTTLSLHFADRNNVQLTVANTESKMCIRDRL